MNGQLFESHNSISYSYQFLVELLKEINLAGGRLEIIRRVVSLLKDFMGFEAVGIRLKEGPDYPYYVSLGFPAYFIEAENYLCAYKPSGDMIRDGDGTPCLECMCGNIIRGTFDPSLPFFTPGGSFWTNSTSELLASTSQEERQGETRNRCNREGYESVALVPLRSAAETIGLLQVNDKRRDMFSPQTIRFLEDISSTIGIAVRCAKQQ